VNGDDGESGVEYVRRLPRRGSAAHVTRDLSTYVLDLLGVGVAYFALAKIGLTLASINPSTSAIWPATGFALAAALMWGYRVGPAILVASFAANITNVGSVYAATAIALGNTLVTNTMTNTNARRASLGPRKKQARGRFFDGCS
jgi:integral membrane sensor domain MASE1